MGIEAAHPANGERRRDRGVQVCRERLAPCAVCGLDASVGDLGGLEEDVPGCADGQEAPPSTRSTASA
jgi:hypothetical protein